SGDSNLSGAGTLNVSGTGALLLKDLATTGTNNVSGGTIKISHDFKPAAFSATGGLVEFNGAGNAGNAAFPLTFSAYSPAQTLDGTATTAFDYLYMNNSAGATLTQTVSATKTLYFASGNITTGSNVLVSGTNATSGVVTGASQSTGWIVGNEKRFLGNDTTAR